MLAGVKLLMAPSSNEAGCQSRGWVAVPHGRPCLPWRCLSKVLQLSGLSYEGSVSLVELKQAL